MTIRILFQTAHAPHLQGVLHTVRPGASASRVPPARQRLALRGAHAHRPRAAGRRSAPAAGPLHRHQLQRPPPLAVCHTARIRQQRGRAAVDAARGTTALGWFSGFKRHLVVTERGEVLSFGLTRGTVDDRQRVQRLLGKLFGDTGDLAPPLAEHLHVEPGVQLITRWRQNRRHRLLQLADKRLLRQRAIIETLDEQLQNICQIEHTCHRRPVTFLVNLVCGLIASCHSPKKPSLDLDPHPDLLVPPAA
jgi:hypothetical protein